MYAFGEQVHAASWPSLNLYRGTAYAFYAFGPEITIAVNQVYAVEGQCFVLMSVAITDDRIIETLIDTDDKAEMLPKGGGFSNIFGPDGSPLVTPLPETEEGLLVTELDLSMIVLSKSAADPVGHYSRPDVTRLLLNTNPAPRLQFMETPMTTVEPSGIIEEEEQGVEKD